MEHEERIEDVSAVEKGKARLGRAWGFVKRHPIGSLFGVAGVGALLGIPWAAGIVVGGAVAALTSEKTGRELREDLKRRGRVLVGRESTPPTPGPT